MADSHLHAAPRAEKRPTERTHHGDTVIDEYAWLADKTDPAVIEYLTAENAWTDQCTAHLEELAEELFTDVRERTLQTDLSVPAFHRHTDGSAYWYYSRTTEGDDYARYCRAPASDRDHRPDLDSEIPGEQVLLDAQAQAADTEFFSLGAFSISPDGHRLAWSVDDSGDERFDLRVRDLDSGEDLEVAAEQIGAGVAWLGGDHLCFVRVDDSWRPFQVWRHRLGTGSEADQLVHTESDDRFWLSADESHVVITAGSKLTTELLLISAADPQGPARLVAPRREGVEYTGDVAGSRIFLLHNENSPDFEVATAELDLSADVLAAPETWQPLLPARPGVRFTDLEVHADFLVVERRLDGLSGVEVHPLGETPLPDGLSETLEFDEPVRTVSLSGGEDFDSPRVRLVHTSLVHPSSVLELDVPTGALTTLKTTPVLDHPRHGAFRPQDYLTERLWATAADGTRIPMSVVRRADVPLDGSAPALLYGYGSYEVCIDPGFSMFRLSLLDRGFVFAIAHIRGGGEMGRAWYEQGKELTKRNTFTDFIACGEHLVAEGFTSPDRLAAQGGSAGGLLMGAVANLGTETFAAIHAAVPFVDALTTILDPELPLTVTEWEEWGDPLHDPEVYAYMKSYTPYENVTAKRYPAILATTSLNDTRVYYTEPAKWVARLRDRATNSDEQILLRTEMVAGHGGVSGRYRSWREAAFEYAWLIDQVQPAGRRPGTEGTDRRTTVV